MGADEMPTVRTFVAVEASDELRAAIGRRVEELRVPNAPQPAAMPPDRPKADLKSANLKSSNLKSSALQSAAPQSSTIKWVEPANLHFAMNFLGDVAAETIPEV